MLDKPSASFSTSLPQYFQIFLKNVLLLPRSYTALNGGPFFSSRNKDAYKVI